MQRKRFRSRTEHTLDAKGRLNFPSRFREVLRQYDSELLMVTAWGTTHLRAYPVAEWELLETKLMAEGREQGGLGKFVRFIVSGVTECELDGQGRIQLPQSLRTAVGLKKDVMLTGLLDWVEIWDKDAWTAEYQSTQDNFGEYEAQLSKLGLF